MTLREGANTGTADAKLLSGCDSSGVRWKGAGTANAPPERRTSAYSAPICAPPVKC